MENSIIIDDTLKFINGLPIRQIVDYYDCWLLGEGLSMAYIKQTQREAGMTTELQEHVFDIYRMFSN